MKTITSLSLAFAFFSCFSFAQDSDLATKVGPEKGSLVIVGGGGRNDELFEKFIELAGGTDALLVVVPTANGSDDFGDRPWSARRLRKLGANNVTVLHTRDPATANSDSFLEPLKNAQGVWFGGGRQWRLVDAYAGTRAEKMFWDVLNRGGVIGGSSAGATIQGSYLARGDTTGNQIMMGDHEEGFSYLKNVAIDQHVLARNRHFDMLQILKSRPELLGISIDENTALIVTGDTFEVLGESYAIVYDGNFWSREGWNEKVLPESSDRFYFLRNGDRYDLANRKVLQK